jgi:regulator of protease activity HflC (stomatin/prohibitin superfamily)
LGKDEAEREKPSVRGYVEPEPAETDDDCCSSCFRCLRLCGGCCCSVICCPFGCCGGGPVIRVNEGYRAAVLRFGKLVRIVGPGTYHYNYGSEDYILKSIKVEMLEIPKQHMMTRDNVTVEVDAVVYFQVYDVKKALFNVQQESLATLNIAQATLRTVIGEHNLDKLFSKRQEINQRLTELIDEHTEPWGVRVTAVEVKDIQIPPEMRRVMAATAEAEREGNAKVITAEAEYRAATTLAKAAQIMAQNPVTLQLRYFQTLTEIASERNSTIIVPSEISGMFRTIRESLMMNLNPPDPKLAAMLSTEPVVPDKADSLDSGHNTNTNTNTNTKTNVKPIKDLL